MVHHLHKDIVPHTNKSNVIRDLLEYQREMHGLRFAFEMEMEDDPNRDDGLCELARLGLLTRLTSNPQPIFWRVVWIWKVKPKRTFSAAT